MVTPHYMKLYTIRLFAFMALYAVILISGLSYKNELTALGQIPLFAIALLTAVPICGVFWTIYRLIIEMDDEYQRLLLVKQTLLGTALMLGITTCWQFLKVYDVIVSGPEWHGAIWLASWGIAAPMVRWRA